MLSHDSTCLLVLYSFELNEDLFEFLNDENCKVKSIDGIKFYIHACEMSLKN